MLVVQRVLRSVAVLLVVVAITYFVFYLGPADPALAMCGRPCNAEDLEAARAYMGFDTPWWQQLGAYLWGIVAGRTFGTESVQIVCGAPCLGYSFQYHEPVTDLILERFPVSFSVAIGAVAIWMLTSTAAALVAARHRNGIFDRAVTGISVIAASAPAYVVGLLAIVLFAFTLDWLPSGDYVRFTRDPLDWALHLILPWTVLAFLNGAVYARLIRSSLIDELNQDYVRTARGAGLGERTVDRYILRNVAMPVTTLVAIDIGALLAGTVITERVFGLPGLGALLLDATGKVDLPIIVGATLFGAVLVVLANLAADLIAPLLDPRMTAQSRTRRRGKAAGAASPVGVGASQPPSP